MTWYGFDGEGVGRFPHRYVMLCVNSADGNAADYIEDVNGLSTTDCLDFLLRYGDVANHSGYFMGYDWTMMLRDMPNEGIYSLLRPELRLESEHGKSFRNVCWNGYELHYLAGMMRIKRGKRSITMWDSGKYYQSRFVTALENSGFAPTDLIVRMKGQRGTESWNENRLDTMRDYCLEECQYLAQLVSLLEAQHTAIGLEPKAWYGPGSTATALCDKYGVRNYIANPPAEVAEVLEYAFFGGRFEHAIAGLRSLMFGFDIKSAYPHAATQLPCLAHSTWVHQRRAPKSGEVALVKYRVTDIGDRVWGPLPCRLDDDSIVWSRGGHSGWAWNVEFEIAQRYWKGVEYAGECWVLKRGCSCKPFDFLHTLYEWRLTRPENKQVVKLAINSVYGKIAQLIGKSRYASRVWAGLITAHCRARMLELIASHGDESRLVAIATDGAYSSEYLDIDKPGLGNWEVTKKGEMAFLRPGIYWSTEDIKLWYADKEDKDLNAKALKSIKARGIRRETMLEQLTKALDAINSGRDKVQLGTTQQFGNARECVYKTPSGEIKRSKAYGEWLDMPAKLSLAAHPKRQLDWRPRMLDGVMSKAYDKSKPSPDAKMLQLIGSMLEGKR